MGTFGKTTIGGSSNNDGVNFIDVSDYALGSTQTITKLTLYLANGAATGLKIRCVIYDDSAGSPHNLKAVSSEVAIANGAAAAWVDFPLPSPVALTAGTYWLGHWSGSSGGGSWQHFYDAGASSDLQFFANTYSSSINPTDPAPGTGQVAQHMSVYASWADVNPSLTLTGVGS